MNIAIALIPALFWGILPIVVTRMGGRPTNQIIGTTLGTFLVAVLVALITRPALSLHIFTGGFLSGLAWAFGQYLQYAAFTKVGVSKAMPISTGLQIAGTSLVGVLFFGEWAGSHAKILGCAAIVLIIIGISLTTYSENSPRAAKANLGSALLILLISTIGYVGYSAFPRMYNLEGWTAFLPQAAGMVSMALLLSLRRIGSLVREKSTWKNILSGFVFAGAALTYLLSAEKNGVATGFTLSQMSVVLSTLGGIYILHENKSRKELMVVLAGLALVVAGGVMIGFIK